jgi:hypothetical protein
MEILTKILHAIVASLTDELRTSQKSRTAQTKRTKL